MKVMKVIFLIVWFTPFLSVCNINGQVHDSVYVSVPGTLYTYLTHEQKNIITSLTVAGKIDQIDIITLRDSLPVLEIVDLSSSTITDNKIPDFAFHLKTTLSQIILPENLEIIGDAAFGSTMLETVDIPPGVIHIGDNAFGNCVNLMSVEIPSSVTYLGWGTFGYCNKLTDVIIPPVSAIGMFTFDGCSMLRDIQIPPTVETIGMSAFQNCRILDSINIPSSVVSIGQGAFSGCWALKNVKLSESLKKLEQYTFGNCFSLESVSIPESVTCIGPSVFVTDTSLANVTLSSNIDTIDYGAFAGCYKLDSEFFIPESVSYLGNGVFMASGIGNITVDGNNLYYSSENGVLFNKDKSILVEYPSLKEDSLYVIPESVRDIREYAFYWCPNLKFLFLPESVISIGNYTFTNTDNLNEIRIFNAEPPDLSEATEVFSFFDTGTCILSVPKGSKASYELASQWNKFVNINEFEAGLILSQDTIAFANTGGIAEFEIYTPLVWNIENLSSGEWIDFDPRSGAGTATITVVAASNILAYNRSIILKISSNYGDFEKLLEIHQAAPAVVNSTWKDNNIESINLYPIPATDFLNLEGATRSDIEIYNAQGRNLISKSDISQIECIDISRLPTGIYFLRIKEPNRILKFVKESK